MTNATKVHATRGDGAVRGKVAPKGSGAARRQAARRAASRRRRMIVAVPVAVLVVIVAVALAVSLGGSAPTKPASTNAVTVAGPARATLLATGERVPAFSAPALTGGTVSWSSYANTPVVLVLWAPWCPHCQKELPILERVAGEFRNVRLVSIVTSVDQAPGPTPEGFMNSNGLRFPVAMDSKSGKLGRAFGLSGFPTIYYVGADGTVRSSFAGEMPETEMRARIQAIAGS